MSAQPTSNAIRATLTRTASVTIHVDRMAGLDPREPLVLRLSSDGAATIRLVGWCGSGAVARVQVPAGASVTRLTPRQGPCPAP